MKLAIICPIGDLNRFGYWRVAQTCLESWQCIGDLFLIHSSRTAIPFSIKAIYIQNEKTLMDMFDGKERFNHWLVAFNANLGIEMARQAGYDLAITICVNWYIEEEAGRAIALKCSRLMSYDFLYRRLQLGDHLFNSDLKSIAMLNLNAIPSNVVKILVDSIEINGVTIMRKRGDFPGMNGEAYIDAGLEVTIDELKNKLSDTRNYEDILPKRHGADWEYWQRYYRVRAAALKMSNDALGPVGQRIAAVHPHEAFGDWMLNEMAQTV